MVESATGADAAQDVPVRVCEAKFKRIVDARPLHIGRLVVSWLRPAVGDPSVEDDRDPGNLVSVRIEAVEVRIASEDPSDPDEFDRD